MSVMYSHAPKYSEGDIRRNQEMDSNLGSPQQHCHQQNSGLSRYHSAPSSLLKSLMEEEPFRSEEDHHHHHHYPPSTASSEMETMLAKLISSNSEPVKQEADHVSQRTQHDGYSYVSPPSQIIYQTQQNQGLSNSSLGGAAGNSFDASFSAVSSLASENYTQTKVGSSSNCSNLIRQKSSPAEFLSNYSVDNGLAELREAGTFRASDVSNGHATTSSSGLHSTLNFSSRPLSCSTRMPRIAENEHEFLQANCVESRNIRNDNGNNTKYLWDGSAFNATKSASNNGEINFATTNFMETMDEDFGNQKLLSHHLSLPSSTTKMDKFLQIQGSVMCKIRAKRGFATHPRSIAERERRTRISSRIKKLQDLFPQSDKQTSTSDLLDLTSEYIKDLQKQLKILTENRAKCTCTSN